MARPRAQLSLSALAEAFAPDGLHGVSASELAAALGVAKPTLYVHGTSKEELFMSAVEAEVEQLAGRLAAAEAASAGRCAQDRAREVALALLEYGAARPYGARLLAHTAYHSTSGVAAAAQSALQRIPDRIAEMLRRDLVGDGLDPELAPYMARAIYASALALAVVRRGERRPARARLAATLASIVPLARPAATEWPSA